jgi:hypothetical protein
MARIISAAAMQAALAVRTNEVFLTCLTILPPTGSTAFAPIHLVDDMQALVRSDATYQPFAFKIQLPDDTDNSIPQVTVTIDSVDRSIIEAIRTVPGLPIVEFFVVLASSPNTVELGPFNFSLLSATYDALVVTGTLGYEEDFLNQQVPSDLYTPTNSPALFAS